MEIVVTRQQLSTLIRTRLKEKEMTQQNVASLSYCTKEQVNNILQGKSASNELMVKVAEAVGYHLQIVIDSNGKTFKIKSL